MRIAFWMLFFLMVATPALVIDGNLIDGAIAGYLAFAIGSVAFSIGPGESDHLTKLIRPAAPIAACIVVWMAVQAMPMPVAAFAHPIWLNAQSAVGQSIFGSISIDTGATVTAIVRFCTVTGIAFVAAATCIDRARAEILLVGLVWLVSLAALALVFVELIGPLSSSAPELGRSSLTAVTSLGVVISAANIIRTVERYETRRLSQNISLPAFGLRLTCAAGAFLVCCAAAVLSATPPVIFSTASGFLMLMMIMLIRRLGFRIWEAVGLIAVAAVTLGFVASLNAGTGALAIRFAQLAPSAKAITSSLIANAPPGGNGAGTFASIAPIYQTTENALYGPHAATTAATSVIELGRFATWLLIFAAVAIIGLLFRNSLGRGRDSFYSTAGTSCLVILLLESFCDNSLLTMPTLIVSATALGLAFGQRLSRTDNSRLSVT